MPRSDPAVLLGWSWSRARCSFSARGRRVDRLPLRFCAQRRNPRRRQVCARRDALSSWREVRRPLPHRPGPSRSSTPDAFAPQARLDPPRGWRAGLAWAPALGSHCGLRGRLRHRRAARSEPIVHCRWFHAPRLPVPLARAASSASRVPSARGAPLGLAAPPPPCTLAHASASASADRLSWATSRLQLGANLAADRTGRVFGVVSPVRVPCAVCCATRCGRTLLDFGAVPPRIDLE